MQRYGGLSLRGIDRTIGGLDRVVRCEQVLRETGHTEYKLKLLGYLHGDLKLLGTHIYCLSL